MFLSEPDRWCLGPMDTVIDIQTTDQDLTFLIYLYRKYVFLNHSLVQFSTWMMSLIIFPSVRLSKTTKPISFLSSFTTLCSNHLPSLASTNARVAPHHTFSRRIYVDVPEMASSQASGQLWSVQSSDCATDLSSGLQELTSPSHHQPEGSSEVPCSQEQAALKISTLNFFRYSMQPAASAMAT